MRRSHFKSGHVSKGQYVGAGLVGPGLVSGTSEVVAGAELRVDITSPSSCQVRSVAVTLQCQLNYIFNCQFCGWDISCQSVCKKNKVHDESYLTPPPSGLTSPESGLKTSLLPKLIEL